MVINWHYSCESVDYHIGMTKARPDGIYVSDEVPPHFVFCLVTAFH